MTAKPRRLGVLSVLALCACGNGDGEDERNSALFPVDYTSSYREVRNCRQSGDHDLNRVRMLADPAAYDPYMRRDTEFPVGSVVLKEEYDIADTDCSGEIVKFTLMSRLESGSSPGTLDWRWQEVDARRRVLSEDLPRCAGCHATCTEEVGGYFATCALP